jgi:hypothetical protein
VVHLLGGCAALVGSWMVYNFPTAHRVENYLPRIVTMFSNIYYFLRDPADWGTPLLFRTQCGRGANKNPQTGSLVVHGLQWFLFPLDWMVCIQRGLRGENGTCYDALLSDFFDESSMNAYLFSWP